MFGARIHCVASRYGRIYAPVADTVIGRSLTKYGEWAEHEIALLSHLMRDGPAIVDVGANIGTHSLAFAARFPRSTVLSFEPQPLAHALLVGSALLNGYENIRPHAMGCSDQTQIIQIAPDYEAVGWNIGALKLEATQAPNATSVLLTPLDDVLGDLDVQLIKIDVEGAEPSVIRGARQTLARCRPTVFFELLDIDALAECKAGFDGLDYAFFWAETSAFNVNNYNGDPENIWSRCEMGVLALPAERAGQQWSLPRVGDETELPFRRDPAAGYTPGEPLT
jgi:FkbM family methyltransferase